MGILRSDLLTHSQLEPSGSVLFDGNSDYLSWSSAAVRVGASDFTLEAWVNSTGNSDANQHQTIFMAGDSSDAGELVLQMIRDTGGGGSALGSGADREIGIRVAGTGYYSGQQITFNQWHHVAVVRDGGTITFFLDGEAGKSHAMTENLTTGFTQIGYRDGSYNGYFKGYISNARIALGAIYKNNFTPSKFELKNVAGTLLLCCQSSTSATTAEVVPSTITANGTAAASSFHPDLKKDITDTGVVFDGFGSFATSTYMVPPKGKTTERNRGRGFFASGFVNPTQSSAINFLNIQSSGNTEDFGDLTVAKYALGSGASSTRGIFHGGYLPGSSPDTDINSIEYITIASTGNAIDFGDRTVVGRNPAAASSSTRVVMAAGHPSPNSYTDTIDFITTATTGNASDFGNLLSATNAMCNANNSPTRGIFSGGNQPSSPYNQNVIQYVTMASAGNATDFGDLTVKARDAAGGTASSSTRGLILIGNSNPNNNLNTIDFITMASTGNASDFGDLFTGRYSVSSCSNSNRAVFLGGRTTSPSVVYQNAMEFVTISTTGNTSDFGDITGATGGTGMGAANSDSHGGLAE